MGRPRDEPEPERVEASEALLTFGIPRVELHAVVSRSRRLEPQRAVHPLLPTASSAFLVLQQ